MVSTETILCLCTGLQSTMNEEREEGGPTSKTTLSGEHGRQSQAKNPEQQERAHSPVPSCVSMNSDRSMSPPVKFEDGKLDIEQRRKERADSPVPSCVSMKIDWSMNKPPEFKDGRPSREESHFVELFPGDLEAFPGQPRDIVSPAYPGSSPGPPTSGTCPKHLTREASGRHPN
ncbi:hypothetical protein N1851_014338 [Merluccius polli]|uniref:Uncharacterized protein n=1 Tax=Merluccius polli TaxID=89951 RepID=A0AA47MTE7_MERPO|nr:hypothetical protein N1851_014338 [Merluccius polli]